MVWRILIAALLMMAFGSDDDAVEWQYIKAHEELAVEEMHLHGIPASIILAQAVVESDAGRSTLALRANNHFGIKCKSWWSGGKYFYADDERTSTGQLVPSCFRFYESTEESFSDHSAFLKYSDRYLSLFSFGADYKAWARGLQQCGYATDRGYGERLIQVIERFHLDALDLK